MAFKCDKCKQDMKYYGYPKKFQDNYGDGITNKWRCLKCSRMCMLTYKNLDEELSKIELEYEQEVI